MLATYCCSVCGTKVVDFKVEPSHFEAWPCCPNQEEHYSNGEPNCEHEDYNVRGFLRIVEDTVAPVTMLGLIDKSVHLGDVGDGCTIEGRPIEFVMIDLMELSA